MILAFVGIQGEASMAADAQLTAALPIIRYQPSKTREPTNRFCSFTVGNTQEKTNRARGSEKLNLTRPVDPGTDIITKCNITTWEIYPMYCKQASYYYADCTRSVIFPWRQLTIHIISPRLQMSSRRHFLWCLKMEVEAVDLGLSQKWLVLC